VVPELDSESSSTIVRNKISENLESCIGKNDGFVIRIESFGQNLDRLDGSSVRIPHSGVRGWGLQ
jgi:hypothetical protein